MASRLPSKPPVIAGFTYIRPLGGGGFADVFLYEQSLPNRQVAVKVFLKGVATPDIVKSFLDEANTMARLAAHPSVLTVFQAAVSADGRPYMVMELCTEGFGKTWRSKPLQLADVLQIGVKLASALETLHRMGKIHRDIKPSNILMTAFNAPVISDFGIASSLKPGGTDEMLAMSVPWSAPEVIALETPGTVASEVWSLGATLYSLIAGRSPFESVDGKNNELEQIKARIKKAIYTPIQRQGIPQIFEEVLLKAMAKNPNDRYGSMQEFAMELNDIEHRLGLRATPIEFPIDQSQMFNTNRVSTPELETARQQELDRMIAGTVVEVETSRRRKSATLPPEGLTFVKANAPKPKSAGFKLNRMALTIGGAVVAGFVIALAVLFGFGVL